jgi:hypothetical protein
MKGDLETPAYSKNGLLQDGHGTFCVTFDALVVYGVTQSVVEW